MTARLTTREAVRLGIQVKADVGQLKPYYPFDSKTEQVFAEVGATLLGAHFGKRIVVVEYHPLAFMLPGGRYSPDFIFVAEDGRATFVECKGTDKARNYRDARSKLRAAASRFPYFTFVEARWPDQRRKLAWEIEEIKIR